MVLVDILVQAFPAEARQSDVSDVKRDKWRKSSPL